MTKVGEHITLDIIGTKKEYEPSFYEKLVYKIGHNLLGKPIILRYIQISFGGYIWKI